MKTAILAVATGIMLQLGAHLATAGDLPTTITVDGATYEQVRWGDVTPNAVTIFHKSGVAKIPLEKLPSDLQQRFGYDPQKAATYRASEQAALRRLIQQDAEAAAKRATVAAAAASSEPEQGKLHRAKIIRVYVKQTFTGGALVDCFWGCHGFVYVEGLVGVPIDKPGPITSKYMLIVVERAEGDFDFTIHSPPSRNNPGGDVSHSKVPKFRYLGKPEETFDGDGKRVYLWNGKPIVPNR